MTLGSCKCPNARRERSGGRKGWLFDVAQPERQGRSEGISHINALENSLPDRGIANAKVLR